MPQPSLFKPLKKDQKIFQQISDQIRELIFSGVLKPGDKLPPEKQLADQCNTGRMVVREALRILEQSGLIHIKQGSLGGAFVKDPDTTVIVRSISDLIKIGNVTLRELIEARLGIEKVILEFAMMRINKEDLTLLKNNVLTYHKRIYEALQEKNLHMAEQIMEKHLLDINRKFKELAKL